MTVFSCFLPLGGAELPDRVYGRWLYRHVAGIMFGMFKNQRRITTRCATNTGSP
jgi:hypothetical protein